MLHRVLVALDGSPESERILPEAERVAGPEAAFDLLHVLHESRRPSSSHPALSEAQAEEYLRRVAGRYGRRRATPHLRHGNPEQEIPEAAVAFGSDLIAMTTHARSALSHLLMGSVAEAVVRSAASPVLLHRPGLPSKTGALARILVPVDGTAESRDVCSLVRRIAAGLDAEAILLQVVVPIVVGDPVTGYVPIGVPELLPDPTRSLEDFARRLGNEGLKSRAVVAFGDATNQILEHARKLDVDLIAMRTAGRSALSRFFMGSVAEKVIRHMECPVLVDRNARHSDAESAGTLLRSRGTT